MRSSDFLITTHKETPSDAEIVSHRLMLRAGLIRKLSSGLYTWMPIGLRVLRRVERVVREEMDRAGALELAMPMVQPAPQEYPWYARLKTRASPCCTLACAGIGG